MTRTVTVEQVMAWYPCGYDGEDDGKNYTVRKVTELFAGRKTLSAVDVAMLGIPQGDRVWALLHPEFFTDEQSHTLACYFAEHILYLCNDDPRLDAAIAANRRWQRDEITDQELDAAWIAACRAAATDTARGAAKNAAWAAAWAAAWNAGDAARGAARAVTRDATWNRDTTWDVATAAAVEWQIEQILKIGGNDDTE